MKKIEAPSLNEALLKASELLGVSVCHIEYEIIQEDSKGFLGFGKKNAIIVASTQAIKSSDTQHQEDPESFQPKTQPFNKELQTSKPSCHQQEESRWQESKQEKSQYTSKHNQSQQPITSTAPTPITQESNLQFSSEDAIYDNFFQNHKKSCLTESKNIEAQSEIHQDDPKNHSKSNQTEIQQIASKIELEINELFALTPFKIDSVTVKALDQQTLFIEFQGEDSALLIGKEGYRYKALSYMLFNWINAKYGLMIRLEIAEFLKNQEEMIQNYLSPIIESIRHTGKGQTRPLNGVLAYIALRQLRESFPYKYVSFRSNNEGEKYVIVNEFIKGH